MNKSTITLIIILAVLLVPSIYILYDFYYQARHDPLLLPPKTPECKLLYDEIEKNLEKANHCTQDSDCDMIILGGFYIEFGCYHYINKNIDKNTIYQKMKEYGKNKCVSLINRCMKAPPVVCNSGKCVSSR